MTAPQQINKPAVGTTGWQEQFWALIDTNNAFKEYVTDIVAAALVAGTNMTVVPNDVGDSIVLNATSGGGGLDAEGVRDTIASALVAGANITVTPDDAGDTITIASTGGGSTDPEVVRDTIANALVAGTGITVTPNDAGDTITIASTIPQYTDEQARDALATALVAGSGITITPNDAADTITIAATGGGSGAIKDTITADVSRTSNVALITTGLAISGLTSGKVYAFEAFLAYSADPTRDLKLNFQCTNCTMLWQIVGPSVGATSNTNNSVNHAVYAHNVDVSVGGITDNTVIAGVTIKGTLITTGSASVDLQFAQVSSGVETTTVKAGSWIHAELLN